MAQYIYELLLNSAQSMPENNAIKSIQNQESLSYQQTAALALNFAQGLYEISLEIGDRIAIYLPKQPETVIAIFGSSLFGAVFVPINSLLKAPQVHHILNDSGAKVLITTADRIKTLRPILKNLPSLKFIVSTSAISEESCGNINNVEILSWKSILDCKNYRPLKNYKSANLAAILYTSGSTGKPKGVMLSHDNVVIGAKSVVSYLKNISEDKILSVLPLSFDYGLSQITTGFNVGASVVLLDYFLPREVLNIIVEHKITGLAGVPSFWIQLAQLNWPQEIQHTLRYLTNSGGALPELVVRALMDKVPKSDIYLMYGLTEAFRSTYLPPQETSKRPRSIGKAIPNATIHVVNEQGRLCNPGEPGELVHSGPLVAMGYWNAPAETSIRFKPIKISEDKPEKIAVWSGDTVVKDQEDFLYFIGRQDELIKTSGYRVSPTEIEEIVLKTDLIEEAIVFGIDHKVLGQSIVLVVSEKANRPVKEILLLKECKKLLPSFMAPSVIKVVSKLPHTPNGKIDRKKIKQEFCATLKNTNGT